MRLYTLTGATKVTDASYGEFAAGPDGDFEFPNDLSDQLHSFHIDGRQAWETDAERAVRLAAEELERFRDPATLLAAVRDLAAHQADMAAALAGTSPTTPPSDPGPGQTPDPKRPQTRRPTPKTDTKPDGKADPKTTGKG